MCVVLHVSYGDAPHTSTRPNFCALASQSSSRRHDVRPESCWNAWSSNLHTFLNPVPPNFALRRIHAAAIASLRRFLEAGLARDFFAALLRFFLACGVLHLCAQVHPSPGARAYRVQPGTVPRPDLRWPRGADQKFSKCAFALNIRLHVVYSLSCSSLVPGKVGVSMRYRIRTRTHTPGSERHGMAETCT